MKKRTIFLIVICTGLGFYGAFRLYNPPKKQVPVMVPMAVTQLTDIQRALDKLVLEEVLVQEITQKQELITMEVEMQETVEWNETWGSWELFKKLQRIHFIGNGIYVTDLQQIQPENIRIDEETDTIIMEIPRPVIKSITLDEQKTTYEATETGWLRFGEVKLTPVEQQIMMQQVKGSMMEKMQSGNMYENAMRNTQSSVRQLLEKIFRGTTDREYKIEIQWKSDD